MIWSDCVTAMKAGKYLARSAWGSSAWRQTQYLSMEAIGYPRNADGSYRIGEDVYLWTNGASPRRYVAKSDDTGATDWQIYAAPTPTPATPSVGEAIATVRVDDLRQVLTWVGTQSTAGVIAAQVERLHRRLPVVRVTLEASTEAQTVAGAAHETVAGASAAVKP